MSGEIRILNTEMSLMTYRHARYLSSGIKMLTETCLMNYGHDKRMSGE